MTIKTDITLPPLPRPQVPFISADIDLMEIKRLAHWCEHTAKTYARAAVEADRQGRMPSDEELLKWAGEEEFFLFCDEDEFLQIARALLSRYSGGQPAANPEHQRLREFYGVLTDRELIDAQQRHIEKLQAKLPASPSMATNRVREG